mmetsp:Transcript_3429/g.8059  ORF Transcript_3429/g.8059 Transcript_3429/m.8059 type:complete len:243 (+) Transcript_3429:169-897(+)|eukprot:g11199.t1
MPGGSSYKDLFDGGLSAYFVFGTQPKEADPGYVAAFDQFPRVPSVTGKRATCTTPTPLAQSVLDGSVPPSLVPQDSSPTGAADPNNDSASLEEVGGLPLEENHDYLIRRVNFVWTPKECAAYCDNEPRCTHWSHSLGPVWNRQQNPGLSPANGGERHPLPFTPKAGAPGHCFVCGVSAKTSPVSQFYKDTMLRDAPGVYSYVGVKRQFTTAPPRIKEKFPKANGPLFDRNWSYLPPKWLRFL